VTVRDRYISFFPGIPARAAPGWFAGAGSSQPVHTRRLQLQNISFYFTLLDFDRSPDKSIEALIALGIRYRCSRSMSFPIDKQ
jgi:hypothetical protein